MAEPWFLPRQYTASHASDDREDIQKDRDYDMYLVPVTLL